MKFSVEACQTVDIAKYRYGMEAMSMGSHKEGHRPPVETTRTGLGNAAVSYLFEADITVGVPGKTTYTIVHVGRFVLTFRYGPIRASADFPAEAEAMIRTFVDKAKAKPATL